MQEVQTMQQQLATQTRQLMDQQAKISALQSQDTDRQNVISQIQSKMAEAGHIETGTVDCFAPGHAGIYV